MARHDRQESRGCRHKAGWQAGIGGLDREEFFVLTVARYFFQSFADPQTEGWTRAMLGAESWLGRDAAPELVHAVFHVIQKMRCARRRLTRGMHLIWHFRRGSTPILRWRAPCWIRWPITRITWARQNAP